jgi:DNA mismatch repair protein MutS
MSSAPAPPPPRRGRQDTPIRRQYQRLRDEHPGCILLFQLGDFFESFEDDARVVAATCGITLTSREFGKGDRVALAGVPLTRLDFYLARLLEAGYRVAVAEQISPPGQGLVERVVTRIVTPGTLAEPGLLRERENNYLAAIVRGRGGIGLAYVDVSTGEFGTTQLEGADAEARLRAEIDRLAPSEVLVPEGQEAALGQHARVTVCQPWRFHEAAARDRLCLHYRVLSLEGYGCGHLPLALGAAGAALSYLQENNSRLLSSLSDLRTYSTSAAMTLDAATRRNLELLRSSRTGRVEGSLLGVLDRTRTPMGGRLMRRWIAQPLVERTEIESRLDAVSELQDANQLRTHIRKALAQIGDTERALGRIAQGVASPREVLDLGGALRAVARLHEVLQASGRHTDLAEGQGANATSLRVPEPCPDLLELIGRALATPSSGRTIRPGYSAELDDLVATIVRTRRDLAELERAERERTGIRSLKVGYNKVFGYYLEVSRSNLPHVPAHYERRQTLVSAERFITPELKEREMRILSAEERIDGLEQALFRDLLGQIASSGGRLRRLAADLARLDVFAALADVAHERGYCRPTLNDGAEIAIADGRHPVVEANLEPGAFIPNDCQLNPGDCQIMIVTGPNMAGKSTYLRQVALIVLMAQMGSFVPAREARIGLVDRVFTRIGAQDDIAAGASTFMVEMMESAAILHHATARSLVVLDEIGRGTSTYDGLSIAQAVVEEIHERLGARTVLATHFHELTTATDRLSRARPFSVEVEEDGDDIVFLRRVVPGARDRSYGVHVARLAGLPENVTRRAEEILRDLQLPDRHLDDCQDTRQAIRHRRNTSICVDGPAAGSRLGIGAEPAEPYEMAMGVATRVFAATGSHPGALAGALADELRRSIGHACAAIAQATRGDRDVEQHPYLRDAAAGVSETRVWIEIAERSGELATGEAQELDAACVALQDRLDAMSAAPVPCLP